MDHKTHTICQSVPDFCLTPCVQIPRLVRPLKKISVFIKPIFPIVAGYYGFVRPYVCLPSVFSFPDVNWSKCRLISTKFVMCIDIIEIWFEMANGQISSIFDSCLPATRPSVFSFPDDKLSKHQ